MTYVPQYQLYQADCLGVQKRYSADCWSSSSIKHFFHAHVYPYGTHMHIHMHRYTSIHSESIITIDASIHWVLLNHVIRLWFENKNNLWIVSCMSQLYGSNQHYQEYNSRCEHYNNLTFLSPRCSLETYIHMLCRCISGIIFMDISKFGKNIIWQNIMHHIQIFHSGPRRNTIYNANSLVLQDY